MRELDGWQVPVSVRGDEPSGLAIADPTSAFAKVSLREPRVPNWRQTFLRATRAGQAPRRGDAAGPFPRLSLDRRPSSFAGETRRAWSCVWAVWSFACPPWTSTCRSPANRRRRRQCHLRVCRASRFWDSYRGDVTAPHAARHVGRRISRKLLCPDESRGRPCLARPSFTTEIRIYVALTCANTSGKTPEAGGRWEIVPVGLDSWRASNSVGRIS